MEHKENLLERLAQKAIGFSGSSMAFIVALSTIIIWLVAGPFFDFSDSWQLVINTGTTIVTFLMVFLIQRMQNKDSMALHLKLNELVAAIHGPSNRLMDVENMSEKELEILADYYKKLANTVKKEKNLEATHSIEEAEGLNKTSRSKEGKSA